jgi:hypothetical protein
MVARVTKAPDLARVREVLAYDEQTGRLSWTDKHYWRRLHGKPAGVISGLKTGKPYIRITFRDILYSAHTLIWFLKTGDWIPRGIDHRDGNGLNNRWDNLRHATESQNNANRRTPKNNQLGVKGVEWCPSTSRSRPYRVYCKGKYVGVFATIDEASRAYDTAAQQAFGEFARLNGSI